MADAWLNYQYLIEFTYGGEKQHDGQCSAISVNSGAVKHGSDYYIQNTKRGGPVKHYVYGGSYTEPLTVSILLGDGARPWLKWFTGIQSGKNVETRNVTLKLSSYGEDPEDERLFLKWDLIDCFPVSWQIKPMGLDDSPGVLQIDMVLQFESMIVSDGDDEMMEITG